VKELQIHHDRWGSAFKCIEWEGNVSNRIHIEEDEQAILNLCEENSLDYKTVWITHISLNGPLLKSEQCKELLMNATIE